MWDCQVSFEGQMTPLVRSPRSAHGDILNRAARNVSQENKYTFKIVKYEQKFERKTTRHTLVRF